MKKKWLMLLCAAAIFVIAILFYIGIQKHSFTLAGSENVTNSEQIQPLFRTVRVTSDSDSDSDVVFTDVETGAQYRIGYITHGVTEKIKLEQGKWYTVTGEGNITVEPVNVRIE